MIKMKHLALVPTRRAVIVMLAASLGLAACSAVKGSNASGETVYHVSSLRPSAQVTAGNEGDKGIVEVYSDNGIGSATVSLISGEWPAAIVMRFHLQGLEGLQFAYDDTIVHVAVNTQNMILQGVSRGGAQEAIDARSSFWMPVSFLDRAGTAVEAPVSGGVIEVLAPADFVAGASWRGQETVQNKEFTINWIDFYR